MVAVVLELPGNAVWKVVKNRKVFSNYRGRLCNGFSYDRWPVSVTDYTHIKKRGLPWNPRH
jgi:hypothetical protein